MAETLRLFFNTLLNPLDIGDEERRRRRNHALQQMRELRRSQNETRRILRQIGQDLRKDAMTVTMENLNSSISEVRMKQETANAGKEIKGS